MNRHFLRTVAKHINHGVVLASVVVVNVAAGAAQSCAMCYQNAAAAGARGRSALQFGILILFIPAIIFFGTILLFLYRRRNVQRIYRGASDNVRTAALAAASLERSKIGI
jgi:hypothetical protein